ncbi:MAG: 3-isopropylmalate dehydratase small subunit [Pseudomonadota bacterium]
MRKPITTVKGPVAVLKRDDIDTDALFPAQFLKKTVREGMGLHLFADWIASGQPEAAFVTAPTQTRILLAGRNFGCGSSREHAVWALADYGIEAIVALSFGDIFRSNCVKNGVVAAVVTPEDHDALMALTHDGDQLELRLADLKLVAPDGREFGFTLSNGHQAQLMSGEDDITRTLRYAEVIAAHEAKVAVETPWLQRMG